MTRRDWGDETPAERAMYARWAVEDRINRRAATKSVLQRDRDRFVRGRDTCGRYRVLAWLRWQLVRLEARLRLDEIYRKEARR